MGSSKMVFFFFFFFYTATSEHKRWTSRFGALMSLSKQLEPLGPMLVFCKLQGKQWMDPNDVSNKHAVELMNTERPGLMDVFCGHWNKRRWSFQQGCNKGLLLKTHVAVRLMVFWASSQFSVQCCVEQFKTKWLIDWQNCYMHTVNVKLHPAAHLWFSYT